MTTNNDSLPDFSGDGKDPFINYGPGGRSPDNAKDEEGVREGTASTTADFFSHDDEEAARQAKSAPSRV